MVNRVKRAFAIFAVLWLIISLPVMVHASTITPRYTYVDSIIAELEIDSTWGIATCSGEVLAKRNMPVEVVVKLQKYVNEQWETLKTWSIQDSFSAYASGHYAIDRGYDYRVYVVGYVYDSEGYVIDIATLAQEKHY